MADTYSKLLGLSDARPPRAEPKKKQTTLLVNQQTSKLVDQQGIRKNQKRRDKTVNTSDSPALKSAKTFDSSLLSTKEKTKYGTYLTGESIQQIRIRAIQTNRDDHQIVQEAVDQYLEMFRK